MRAILIAVLFFLLGGLLGAAELKPSPPEADIGGAPLKREEVFEFAKQPTFKNVGKDRYEISFASKGWCDVTVSIIDQEGKVIRHLACGVLGPKAPEPLQKNSLSQTIVWDGKNDMGRYVDPPEPYRVKVCLGLKPTFDKVLIWHPNRWTRSYGMACDRDGVYVLLSESDKSGPGVIILGEGLLVYDHEGNYRRTILPPPRDKVQTQACAPSSLHGQGIPRSGKPAGGGSSAEAASAPAKAEGPPYALVLPTGKTIISPTEEGNFIKGLEPNAFCVADGTITAVVSPGEHKTAQLLFRLKTDGAVPEEGYYSPLLGQWAGSGPCWLAVSADRKWVYVSGLGLREQKFQWTYTVAARKEVAKHAVYRLPFDLKGKMEPFLGKEGEPGEDNSHFKFPEGVACDRQGRLYVSDTGNNRVQVFQPDGKFIKSIPVPEPQQVAVHPETGAIYIISYPWEEGYFKLLKLNGLEEAKVVAEQEFKTDASRISVLQKLCLDHWTKEPTLWIAIPAGNVQLWMDKGNKFELKRDLFADLKKEWKGQIVQVSGVGNLVADPWRPHLYLGDTRTGGPLLDKGNTYRINTDTGEVAITLGATAIGYDGFAYVRGGGGTGRIGRRNLETGKPVAFDYGEGDEGALCYRFCDSDGLDLGVSPWGDVLYHDRWPPAPGNEFVWDGCNECQLPAYLRARGSWNYSTYEGATMLTGYQIRQYYPGRVYGGSSAILLYDRSGKLTSNDAIEGIPRVTSGMRMDFQGNMYIGVPMAKMADGKLIMGWSVAKFGPKGGRFIANGPGVPVPIKDPPNRPADFGPYNGSQGIHGDKGPHGETGYGDKTWAEGMLWSFGGYFPRPGSGFGKCICLNSRFDLDFYGRLFVPEGHRSAVAVLDANGNFILRLGEYGNCDDRGPEIRLAHCRYVAASEKRLYLNDLPNNRILSVDLKYEKEAVAKIE